MAASNAGSALDGIDGPGSGIDWWSILEALDARRVRALTDRDPGALAEYLVPGSPAWDADSGVIAELRGQGLTALGLATHIVAIERVEVATPEEAVSGGASPDVPAYGGASPEVADGGQGEGDWPATEGATVVLVDERSAYSLVDAQGDLVHSVDSPGSQRWEVKLVRMDGTLSEGPQSGEPPTDEPRSEAGSHAGGQSPSGGPASADPPLGPLDGDAGWRIAEVTQIP